METAIHSTHLRHTSGIRRFLRRGDAIYNIVVGAAAVLLIVLVAGFGVMLWSASGVTRASEGAGFVVALDWNPSGGVFGALPFIVGTLATSAIALVVAVPLSLAIAVFLAELCPARLRGVIGTTVEMLAAIPSVVYGLWGIFAFIPDFVKPVGDFIVKTIGTRGAGIALPVFSGPFFGTSLFAAGLILAIMIIPTITAMSRDVLLAIPRAQREASFGLGATQAETIMRVLIPYGMSGILGAVILGLGRALGETMAITMTVGNVSELPVSVFNAGYTLSSVIANEWGEASGAAHASALIEIGLILFVTSLLLNVAARFLVWNVTRRNPEQRD